MKLTSSQLRKIIREELNEVADPQQALISPELKSKWLDLSGVFGSIKSGLGFPDSIRTSAFLESLLPLLELLREEELSIEELQLMIKYAKTLYHAGDKD